MRKAGLRYIAGLRRAEFASQQYIASASSLLPTSVKWMSRRARRDASPGRLCDLGMEGDASESPLLREPPEVHPEVCGSETHFSGVVDDDEPGACRFEEQRPLV